MASAVGIRIVILSIVFMHIYIYMCIAAVCVRMVVISDGVYKVAEVAIVLL